MITYEEAIKVLSELQESAKYVREYEDDLLDDFHRFCLEDEKKHIIDILVKLELK